MVVEGELVRGAYGFAAELGHVRMVPDGHLAAAGSAAAGSSMPPGRRSPARLGARRSRTLSAPRLLERAGGTPGAITGPHVTAAAMEGDELAIELLADLGRWIGEGCASIAAVLDPEVFVIGGGVIAAGDLMLGPAREAFEAPCPPRATGRSPRFLRPTWRTMLGSWAPPRSPRGRRARSVSLGTSGRKRRRGVLPALQARAARPWPQGVYRPWSEGLEEHPGERRRDPRVAITCRSRTRSSCRSC